MSAKHGHRIQFWLLAAAIVVLAVVVAYSITELRGSADVERQEQVIVGGLSAQAQQVSRIEWQAAAERRVSDELDAEFVLVHRQNDEGLAALRRFEPEASRELYIESHRYFGAVEEMLGLIKAGRLDESREFDEAVVDPSFFQLQRHLEQIGEAEGRSAEGFARRVDLGIVVTLMLAALILIVLLWRIGTLRDRATRRTHQNLETQALEDELTGLPNRRKLLADLERELRHAPTETSRVLILCDLDGFKTYNDTFGHAEGDLLLARLGGRLAGAVAPGTAYRLGGDEFCALLRVEPGDLEPRLETCRTALFESGSGFEIRASIGAVVLHDEASEPSAALRLADQRMYAQKNERGSSVKQQVRDLVMRVLAEQDAELYEHVNHVGRLAAGVGRRLGLAEYQVAELVRAAELHDVGKVAIPDSILSKPGPLDPEELRFVRRHPLIGENILSAAPALASASALVRSSHEHFDGAGYPDGLRTEDIPLCSRIISACDAFHAMTTDRPYRAAIDEDAAIAELERCAGSQFDPVVAAALVAELAELRTARERYGDELPSPEFAATPH